MSFVLPRQSTQAPSRTFARSGTGLPPAPLTLEEWTMLLPGSMDPSMLPMLQPFRALIESLTPQLTPMLLEYAAIFRAEGLQIPDRFFVQREPSEDEIVQYAATLIRKIQNQSYAGA